MVLSFSGTVAGAIVELIVDPSTTALLCDDDTLAAAILMHERRPGRRALAAMLARMPHHARWRAALSAIAVPECPF